MLTKGSALNVGKGWAVASLFRKARENRQAKFYLKSAGVDSIGQRNSYVKTWGCGGFLNETNIYSRGKSLCF